MDYSSKADEYNKPVHGIEKKDYSGLVERMSRLSSLRGAGAREVWLK